MYNSKGKGKSVTIENIGGETITSSSQEKLLGLHINSDVSWNTHVGKLSIELKKRIGLLTRIRNRIPENKLVMVANSIFNSKIRYGISVYLNPIFEEEDLKAKKSTKNVTVLQVLQNTMLRIILKIKKNQHINMQKVRENIGMMSVNQMSIYHTILEAYNIVKYSSSDQMRHKWESKKENTYYLRSESRNDMMIPKKSTTKCIGFTYFGAKLLNMLPSDIKESENSSIFKAKLNNWIWQKIPSY